MPPSISDIGRTIRNIKRAQEILTVLARYGFGDVLQELKLDRVAFEGRRLIGLTKKGEEHHREPQAVRLRQAMEELGPTFIKMAQILSTRRDLIPEEWAAEFRKLQSDVPAVPAEKIEPHLRGLYNGDFDERFREVDFNAFAAASIGQAHAATLADGTPVILKVLRPGIRRVLESDIEILRALAEFAESRFADLGYSPTRVIDQFERQVLRETDLLLELRNIRRMAGSFEDEPGVGFPDVYREHSRDGVICMQRIEGELLATAGPDAFTDDERRAIVSLGAGAVFRQCFEIGFFHADPHPGNMFVVRDAEAPDGLRLVFIDCGMVGHIDPRTAEQLADLVHGTVKGELDRVIDVVVTLTDAGPAIASDRAFRADVWEFISRFQADSLAELQMGALLEDFFSKVRRHQLECPADIVYLIKAVTTIEGVGEAICPEFDLIGHVTPHVERLVRRRYGFSAIRARVENAAVGYADLVERLPRDMRDLLQMFRRDKVVVKLQHQGLDRLTDELERASGNIAYALVISALVVGAAILFMAAAVSRGVGGGTALSVLAVTLMLMGAFLAIVRIVSALRR